MAFSFLRFIGHTQRCTTVGRTPLDEWSVRCKDNARDWKETNIHAPERDSNPQSQQARGRRPTSYTARPLGLAKKNTFSLLRNTYKGKGFPPQSCKHIRRAEIRLHSFLTSVLDEDGRSASRPGRFAPMESAPVHLNSRLVGALYVFEKKTSLVPFGVRSPHRPACSYKDHATLAAPIPVDLWITGSSSSYLLVTGGTFCDKCRIAGRKRN